MRGSGPGRGPRRGASLAPAAAVDAERLLQPLPTGGQERLAEQQRARELVEDLVRWGDAGTDRRPAQPRRNAHGSAEGDRFRCLKTDLRGFVADAAGARRSVRWNPTCWMVPGLPQPAWMEFEHSAGAPARADGTPLFEARRDALLEQHTLHQLIAPDLLRAPPVLAGTAR